MLRISELLYPWDEHPVPPGFTFKAAPMMELDDETLRDGLQSPGVRQPPIDKQIEMLHLMDRLGISTANIGLPANAFSIRHIRTLAESAAKLSIIPNVACRTMVKDIEPVVEIAQACGRPITVYTFIGSSEIRRYIEQWDLPRMLKDIREAVSFAVDRKLPVAFVTEDTTRTKPDVLSQMFDAALDHGAERLVICDTCGAVTPTGVRALCSWLQCYEERRGTQILFDWHGHDDRGLALANAIEAARCGVDRIHATALGIGERAGNTSMDLLMVNLARDRLIDPSRLAALSDYTALASAYTGREIPAHYPVFGTNVFTTGTGVHAAAVTKALSNGDPSLADLVYSSIPAAWVGRSQRIVIGPMSGAWNVRAVCTRLGIGPVTDPLIEHLLALSQGVGRELSDEEVVGAVERL